MGSKELPIVSPPPEKPRGGSQPHFPCQQPRWRPVNPAPLGARQAQQAPACPNGCTEAASPPIGGGAQPVPCPPHPPQSPPTPQPRAALAPSNPSPAAPRIPRGSPLAIWGSAIRPPRQRSNPAEHQVGCTPLDTEPPQPHRAWFGARASLGELWASRGTHQCRRGAQWGQHGPASSSPSGPELAASPVAAHLLAQLPGYSPTARRLRAAGTGPKAPKPHGPTVAASPSPPA